MSEHESEKKKGDDISEFIKQYLLSPVDEFMHSVYKVGVAAGLGHGLLNGTWRATTFTLNQVLQNAFGLKIDGQEHVPKHGPAIIVTRNSWGAYPFIAWVVAANSADRILFQAFDADYFNVAGLRSWLHYLSSMAVLDGRLDDHTKEFAAKKLNEGELVGLSLENASMENDNVVPVPNLDIVDIARASGVPVIPVSIPNAEGILDIKTKKYSFNQKILVTVHEPVDVSKGSPEDAYKALRARMEE